MPTFKELDDIISFLPKDVVKIIYSYTCRNCDKERYVCEKCWYCGWSDYCDKYCD